MKIRPLGDRILVKREEASETVRGGIIIPDSAKEKPQEAKVVAVGKGKVDDSGKLVPMEVKKGDRILLGKYAGTEVKIDDVEHIIVREDDVLAIIEDLRGTPKTAEGARQHIQQIYNYAIQKLIAETNPALPLRGVIDVPRAQHHRHLNEEELGAFWNSVARQGAHFVTIAATQFLMYTMCRKSEVIRSRWTEFDLAKAQWDIPAARMKSRRPHRVYLATQAIELLKLLRAKTGEGTYVFPSTQRATVPLVDCTLNHFFKRLDFGVEEFSPHGTRGTAATLLREHGFGRDVVELLLAHTEKSQTAAAYHHHELEPERRRALQYLADQIDQLAKAERLRRQAAPAASVVVDSELAVAE
jgi:co-chaperonin GroES (HSP10)